MAVEKRASGKKLVVVGVRLTPQEAAEWVDGPRGRLTRTQYVRLVLRKAREAPKEG
jgi:hypothetical protein